MTKLIKVLLESRKCIDSIVESSAMVNLSFMAEMKLPKELLDKKKAEEASMEDIISRIDSFLGYVKESEKESEEKT
jgi:hypothetical protein